ncbi:MAG TPA: site-2 protease family protein [Candidatus Acidoferrum sp.]|nr:site-2 protease family protein [Candidatus Acidoferrum sp.]
MTRQTVTLGRLFGICVGVHVSWLIVYALMTFALARGLEMLPAAQAYAFGAVCALALFASVVAHEFAHALVARRFGVRTAAITLFLFGGVATLDEEPPSPRAEVFIALAGPALSAVLAGLSFAALVAVERLIPGRFGTALGLLTAYLAIANGVLAVFNLVPAYPMDGGRVLRALLWRARRDRLSATRIAAGIAIGFALAFVAAGVLLAFANHNATYAWYAVLGAFLLRQGWSEERAARLSRSAAASEIAAAA